MRNMNMWLAAACMGVLVGCSGASSGAPSNTEIEEAIKKLVMKELGPLAGDHFDVSVLEVKNGHMNYDADVSFRITMKVGGKEEADTESGHLTFSRGKDGWVIVGKSVGRKGRHSLR